MLLFIGRFKNYMIDDDDSVVLTNWHEDHDV